MGLVPIFCLWARCTRPECRRGIEVEGTGRVPRSSDGSAGDRTPKSGAGRRARPEEIEAMITPVVESLRCGLWGIDLQTQGRNSTLRIYIDREEGVSVEDCEAVSRRVSALMDVEEPLPGNYTLEVSSPGMDRILFRMEQYAESVGETVDVRLIRPFEGRRRLTGLLAGIEDDEIVLRVEDDEYLLPLEWIQRARIVPRFE
ncbi:MAG TPA: ribosome maturation factor RimP [Pseudomonadales bacterium]|nr:ribosome maturation factor RimP [Pseudomonadales bacterium]